MASQTLPGRIQDAIKVHKERPQLALDGHDKLLMIIVHCLVGAFGIFRLPASARNLDDNHKVVAGVRYYTAIAPHEALVGC